MTSLTLPPPPPFFFNLALAQLIAHVRSKQSRVKGGAAILYALPNRQLNFVIYKKKREEEENEEDVHSLTAV